MHLSHTSRRDVVMTIPISLVLSAIGAASAAAQPYPVGPVRPQVGPTERPGCTISQALEALAQNDQTYREFLQLSIKQIDEALEGLNKIDEDDKGKALGETIRFQEETNVLLQSEGEITLVGDYVNRMTDALTRCRETLEKIQDPDKQVTDEDVLVLFRLLHGVSLLNADVVGFGT